MNNILWEIGRGLLILLMLYLAYGLGRVMEMERAKGTKLTLKKLMRLRTPKGF